MQTLRFINLKYFPFQLLPNYFPPDSKKIPGSPVSGVRHIIGFGFVRPKALAIR